MRSCWLTGLKVPRTKVAVRVQRLDVADACAPTELTGTKTCTHTGSAGGGWARWVSKKREMQRTHGGSPEFVAMTPAKHRAVDVDNQQEFD